MKSIRHNLDGSTETEYSHPAHTLESVMALLRFRTSRRIAERVPEHDRENAALGLIDKTAICAIIAEERSRFAAARRRVESAFAAWDGSQTNEAATSAAIIRAYDEDEQ